MPSSTAESSRLPEAGTGRCRKSLSAPAWVCASSVRRAWSAVVVRGVAGGGPAVVGGGGAGGCAGVGGGGCARGRAAGATPGVGGASGPLRRVRRRRSVVAVSGGAVGLPEGVPGAAWAGVVVVRAPGSVSLSVGPGVALSPTRSPRCAQRPRMARGIVVPRRVEPRGGAGLGCDGVGRVVGWGVRGAGGGGSG